MGRILFLVTEGERAHNDNHLRLPAAFRDAGWETFVHGHDTLQLRGGTVLAAGRPVADHDLVWVLGLGRAATFFDRMQLLHRVPQDRFVTRIDALMYLHAKYAWSERMPETHADNDPDRLFDIVAGGGDWVAKPTAGSFGRDVERVSPDSAGHAALVRLTGGPARRYCLLQRYVPEIESGEKRTLIAGERIIGTYLRLPGADFRANLSRAGRAEPTVLTAAESRRVAAVHREVLAAGIGFAAIDIAGPYLMEVNLANPGGLGTLEALYGEDPAPRVVAAFARRR